MAFLYDVVYLYFQYHFITSIYAQFLAKLNIATGDFFINNSYAYAQAVAGRLHMDNATLLYGSKGVSIESS